MEDGYLYDKLREARELRKDGKRDEAFSIYRTLLLGANINDVLFYHFNCEAISDEMAKQLYEEKKYNYYLHAILTSYGYTLCGLAAQGRYEKSHDYGPFDGYGPQTKITKALKELRIFEQVANLKSELREYVKPINEKLVIISELSKQIDHESRSRQRSGQSNGERRTIALRANPNFMQRYQETIGPLFDDYFTNSIAIRLVDSK